MTDKPYGTALDDQAQPEAAPPATSLVRALVGTTILIAAGVGALYVASLIIKLIWHVTTLGVFGLGVAAVGVTLAFFGGLSLSSRLSATQDAALARFRRRHGERLKTELVFMARLKRHPLNGKSLALASLLSAVALASVRRQGTGLLVQILAVTFPIVIGTRALWPPLSSLQFVGPRVVGPAIVAISGFFWLDWRDAAYGASSAALLAVAVTLRLDRKRIDMAVLTLAFAALLPWYLWSERVRLQAVGVPTTVQVRSDVYGPRVGVALSGGGFRAALFHAGVLHELKQRRVDVRVLSTVSGGSAIGSFYVNGGAPDDFVSRVARGQLNIAKEALTVFSMPRLVASWRVPWTDLSLWPTGFSRTQLLADQLDRAFLKGRPFSEPTMPTLLVSLSDVGSGTALSLWFGGHFETRVHAATERMADSGSSDCHILDSNNIDEHLLSSLKESQVVAASSAFPIAFDGLRFGDRHFVDGGIIDNSGVGALLCADAAYPATSAAKATNSRASEAFAVDRIIASDGSALPIDNDSPTDWIDTMHRATGPNSFTSEARVAKRRIDVVSPTLLLTASTKLRSREPWKHRPELLAPLGSTEWLSQFLYLTSLFRQCIENSCHEGWHLTRDDFATLVQLDPNTSRRPCETRLLQEVVRGSLETALQDGECGTAGVRSPTELLAMNWAASFIELCRVFQQASTLQSQFTEAEATSLFNLGREAYLLSIEH